MKSILAGEQYSTIFKDTSELAKATVKMIQEITSGGTVTVNDTKTYDNGIKVVPTELLQPVPCDKSNCKQILLDAKYYTEAQLG